MILKRLLVAGVFSALFMAVAWPAFASVETMTVSEIEPGMQGICKTVIRGTEIRDFDCEVIDVFSSMGFNGGPLILLRISGDVVDESGGIAGGYSGSPVYIDGKLIGALSWGPYYTEGDIVGATPIHEMLRTWTYPANEPVRISEVPAQLDEPLTTAGHTFDSIILTDYGAEIAELEEQYGPDTLVMLPCRTPLLVSGLSTAGFEHLKGVIDEQFPYLDLVQGPGGSGGQIPVTLNPVQLEPGASIGAQLASGDLDLTAIGTLTWVDENGRFLAFGHPFLMNGETNMPFVTSEILYTMPSMDRSYKMGEPIEVVGTVTQDRLTCIGGQLGMVPDMVDFSMRVTDHDVDRVRNFEYSVINNEDYLALLGWLVPMEGLLYSSDRTGPATVRFDFAVHVEGWDEPIERSNLSFSTYGSSGALNEFMEIMMTLTSSNQFNEVKIERVELEVEITSARQTMTVLEARYQNPPNMGPGAIGYTGPQEPDKAEKDRAINEAAEWLRPSDEEIQNMPLEDLTQLGMDMMEDYTEGYTGESQLVQYRQGDTIEILVTMRPYREKPVEMVFELEIPEDFPLGQTTFEISGGSYSYYYGMFGYYDYGYYGYTQPESIEEVVEEFLERSPGNSVTLRLYSTSTEDDPYYYLQEDYEEPEQLEKSYILGDVIYGYYSLPIEIVSESGETAPAEGEMPTDEELEEAMAEILEAMPDMQ